MTKIDSFLYFLHALATTSTVIGLGMVTGFEIASGRFSLVHLIAM